MEQILGKTESYPHHLPGKQKSETHPDLVTTKIIGSPLSDRLILAHMKAGNIVIVPFEESQLQNSSYDLRLGRYYYQEQNPGADRYLFNPYNKNHVKRVWGGWQKAVKAKSLMGSFPNGREDWEGIYPDDDVILFEPQRTYLCHTHEFIGMRNVGTTMMKARSTIGRIFLEVCKCAGWGDNGYINRWTMEITNNSLHHAIPVVVGTRIAQLTFFYTGETDRPYHKTGSYQNSADINKLIKEWDKESMLPKLKRDPKL